MKTLQEIIQSLETIGEWLLELPSTITHYYDDFYGYPKSRQVLFIQLVAALGVAVGIYEICNFNF